MDTKQTEKLLQELVSKIETTNELTYPKKQTKELEYLNLDEHEILSLLEEKKEQLRISVDGLDRYKESIYFNIIKYSILIIFFLSSISAIVIPLYKKTIFEFYPYIIAIGIILIFVLGYLLIDKQAKITRKINQNKIKQIKIFEAWSLIRHVENIIDIYSRIEKSQF